MPTSSSSSSASSADHRSSSHKRKKSKKKEKKSRKKRKESSRDEAELFVYDRDEVMRLTVDLLHISGSLRHELRQLYKRLDARHSVILTDLQNKGLRKKLRHLFQELQLDLVDKDNTKAYRKPKKCSPKLVKLYDSILKDIDERKLVNYQVETNQVNNTSDDTVESPGYTIVEEIDNEKPYVGVPKGPTMPTIEELEEANELYSEMAATGPQLPISEKRDRDITDEKQEREEWMTEAPAMLSALFGGKKKKAKVDPFEERKRADEARKMKEAMQEYNREYRSKSLLEMHREGNFQHQIEEQKQYIASHQLLKGGEPSNKKSKGSKNDEGDAWEVFDRERDLNMRRQVDAHDFHRLLDRSKKLNERFGESHFQSSFL